jgi:hypothetical protein
MVGNSRGFNGFAGAEFASRLRRPACFALWLLASAAAPAVSAPSAPISENNAQQIVAASPLRELNRAWTQCIDEALFLVQINTIAEVTKIQALVDVSCEAYESRLTGELIARRGYSQGNAVMAALKRKVRARFEGVARAVSAKPKNYYSQVGGWMIYRQESGGCAATIDDHKLVDPNSSWLALDGKSWRLGFFTQLSYAKRYEEQDGQLESMELSAFSSGNVVGTANVQLRFEVTSDLIGWSMPMDDNVATELRAADRVQFRALTEQQYVERVFPIAGITAAWSEVRKCASQ